jgi:D-amino-acid oxidase
MAEVLVLGAGIVGLNAALRLALETKYKVKVLAASFFEITSAYAGAYWWPSANAAEEASLVQWSIESFEFLKTLGTEAGVAQRKIIGLMEEPWEIPPWFSKIKNCRMADPSEVNASLNHGLVIDSGPVVEPSIHLKWLRERLISLGASIDLRKVSSFDEAFEECPIVVNCTGLGARELCQDSDLHPVSGQLVKIRLNNIENVIFVGNRPERTAYIIPQSSYTILGGTYFVDDWRTDIDGDETIAILERCNELCPTLQVTEKDVIGGSRALRPARSRIRLEHQAVSKGHLIHNYGQGRSGFSLAYGCAGTVVQLISAL